MRVEGEGEDEESPLLPSSTPGMGTGRSTAMGDPTRDDTSKTCWQLYSGLIDQKPLLTKSLTATLLFLLADLIAQWIEHMLGKEATKSDDTIFCGIDIPRVARFAAFGLFGAPWSHYYFLWLDRCLPPSPEPWTLRTFIKVFIDQFIQAPLLLAVMIGALSIMKGTGLKGAKEDLAINYEATLIANCRFPSCPFLFLPVSSVSPGKLWLPFSAINLALVKPSMRVLFVNLVFIVWTVILSLMLN